MDIILHKKIHIRILLILTALVVLSGSKCQEIADLPDTCKAWTVMGPIEFPCQKVEATLMVEDKTPYIDNRDFARFDANLYTPIANDSDDIAGKWLVFSEETNSKGLKAIRYTCDLTETSNHIFDSNCEIFKPYLKNAKYPSMTHLNLDGNRLISSQFITESMRGKSLPSGKYYRYDKSYTLYIELTFDQPGRISGKIYSSNILHSNHAFEELPAPEGEDDFVESSRAPTFEQINFTMVRLGDENLSLGTYQFRNRFEARSNPDLVWEEPDDILNFYESEQLYSSKPNFVDWNFSIRNGSLSSIYSAAHSGQYGVDPKILKFDAYYDDGAGNYYVVDLDAYVHNLVNDVTQTIIHGNSIVLNSQRKYTEMFEILINITF